jgi:enoyl-CoA hydratase/carnithine racemase
MAGLVSAVFDDAALIAEATSRGGGGAAKAPNAVRLTKALMKRQPEPVAARMAEEARHFGAQLASPEVREAITAFLQKRVPDFSSFS